MEKKKIFVSYSDEDRKKKDLLVKLIRDLKSFEPIVIAERRESQKLLSDKVIDGILSSDVLIPIITRNSINTQWLNQEIGYAKAILDIKKKILIRPIIEAQLLDNLKGFIHKELDIPYKFQGDENKKRKESISFKKSANILLMDLEDEYINKINKKDYALAPNNIFTISTNRKGLIVNTDYSSHKLILSSSLTMENTSSSPYAIAKIELILKNEKFLNTFYKSNELRFQFIYYKTNGNKNYLDTNVIKINANDIQTYKMVSESKTIFPEYLPNIRDIFRKNRDSIEYILAILTLTNSKVITLPINLV